MRQNPVAHFKEMGVEGRQQRGKKDLGIKGIRRYASVVSFLQPGRVTTHSAVNSLMDAIDEVRAFKIPFASLLAGDLWSHFLYLLITALQ